MLGRQGGDDIKQLWELLQSWCFLWVKGLEFDGRVGKLGWRKVDPAHRIWVLTIWRAGAGALLCLSQNSSLGTFELTKLQYLLYLGSWEILNRWSQKRRRRGRRGRRNFREMQGMLYFGTERGTVLFSTFQTLSAVSNSESMDEWLQITGRKTYNIAQIGVTGEG